MAAGFSRRFGCDDKRTVQLAGGGTLLGTTLAAIKPAFTDCRGRCLLAAVIRPQESPSALGIPDECMVLRAPNAVQGLGASIADAIRAVQENPRLKPIHSVAILLGDMPAIRADTAANLLRYSSAASIVRPRYRGRLGHPVLFGRDLWSDLRGISGEDGARQVIAAHSQALIVVDVEDEGILLDIDRAEDIHRAMSPRPGTVKASGAMLEE